MFAHCPRLSRPNTLVSGLILLLAGDACVAVTTPAQAGGFAGRWQVDVSFTDASRHSLRFDAKASGTGSLLLQDPRSSLVEPAEPSDAKWTQTGEKVTFSGLVEFPLGNVGRETGTLLFKGTLETNDAVTGDVTFYSANQDPADPNAVPSKKGTFKATRVG